MIFKKFGINRGTVTVELAFSFLSVIVLALIMLGLFSVNLNNMIESTVFLKSTNSNNSKTYYDNFSKNYADFTIKVKE